MSKNVIECEYCHTLISEEDTKCPSCGANCSNAIKKYRKEQEEKMKAERDRVTKTFGDVADAGMKSFKVSAIVIGAIFIAAFGLIIYSFVSSRNDMEKEFNDFNVELEKEKQQEVVTVKYQEEAVTNDMKVTLSSYENYAYYSEHFDNYNTPEGYQKIAFLFEIENLTDNDIYLWNEKISLTADDFTVEDTSLKAPGSSFATVVEGKESYTDISGETVKAKSKLKGYVGYLVPKDKKNLKFSIGKYIIIEMDNPSYNG